MTHPATIARNNLEAARILDQFGESETAAFLRHVAGRVSLYPAPAVPYHVALRPPAVRWHQSPPAGTGTFQWRRSDQWEPIARTIPASRLIFSHRYEKEVSPEALGGEWLY